jgi:membrane protein implicated in regulation of membrane protease activity
MRLARPDFSTLDAGRLAAVPLWAGMIMVLVPVAPPGLALTAVAVAAAAAAAASAAVVPIVVVAVVVVIALGGRRRLSGRLRDNRRRWGRGRDSPVRR